jgi:ribosomal protein S2
MKIVNLSRAVYLQLLHSGIHVGGDFSELDSFNFDFVCGKRFGYGIMDLRNTLISMRRSNYILVFIIANRGKLLFVDNFLDRSYQKHLYLLTCVGQFFLNSKIPGGIFTNFKYVYFDIVSKFFIYNKKNSNERHFDFLQSFFSFSRLRRLPDFTFIACEKRTTFSFDEIAHLRLPSVTLLDGTTRHVSLLFPLFGNNENLTSLIFFVEFFCAVVLAGYLYEIREFFITSRRHNVTSKRFKLLYWLLKYNKRQHRQKKSVKKNEQT